MEKYCGYQSVYFDKKKFQLFWQPRGLILFYLKKTMKQNSQIVKIIVKEILSLML